MQNKRMILVMGVLILLVGAAAFVAGRMLNSQVSPLSLFGMGGRGDVMTVRVNVIPAEELPTTRPEVVGLFVERKDNTIVVSSIPMKATGGGIAAGSKVDIDSGPKVEVLITNETIIYRDATIKPSGPPPGENETIQQTVEESTLDKLNTESMVTVWGRKSGDRVIAEVLVYSNPVMFKRPDAQ